MSACKRLLGVYFIRNIKREVLSSGLLNSKGAKGILRLQYHWAKGLWFGIKRLTVKVFKDFPLFQLVGERWWFQLLKPSFRLTHLILVNVITLLVSLSLFQINERLHPGSDALLVSAERVVGPFRIHHFVSFMLHFRDLLESISLQKYWLESLLELSLGRFLARWKWVYVFCLDVVHVHCFHI